MFISISNAIGSLVNFSTYVMSLIGSFKNRVYADDGEFEAEACLISQLDQLESRDLLDTASLVVTPNAVKENKLFSIVPVSGAGDLDVVRATTATRVNSDGLIEVTPYNLLQQSQTFDNAIWTKLASTITANATIAPNGTNTADKLVEDTTNNQHRIDQTTTSVIGTNTFSVFAKKSERDSVWLRVGTSGAYFDLTNGTISGMSGVTASIENYGNGWYKCIIVRTSTVANEIARINLAIGTNGTYAGTAGNGLFIWGAQLVSGTSAKEYFPTTDRLDVPRLDYTGGGCPAILVEPQRTNLLLNSVFDGTGSLPTSWVDAFTTGTSAPAASTKSTIGQAYTFTTSGTRRVIVQLLNQVTGTTYAFSVYVENVSGSIPVSEVVFLNGAGTQTFYKDGELISSSTPVVSGSRYTAIFVASATVTQQVRLGNGCTTTTTGTVRLSMPQLETGSNATSYIPTVAASVTRNADALSLTNVYTKGFVSSAGGTFFVDLKNNLAQIRASAYPTLFLSSNTSGTGTTSIGFGAKTTSSRLFVYYIANGTFVETITTTSDTAKIAISWTPNSMKIFQNGVLLSSITGITWDITTLQNLAEISQVVLNINSMALFPTALTDAQLELLTGSSFYTYDEMAIALNYNIQ